MALLLPRAAVAVGCTLLLLTACNPDQLAALTNAAKAGQAGQGLGPGVIRGTVIDSNNQRPIGGARITVGTAFAITDMDGRFEVPGLPVGDVKVQVEQTGYASYLANATVGTGVTALNLTLRPSTVTGSPPPSSRPSAVASGSPSAAPSGPATPTPTGTPHLPPQPSATPSSAPASTATTSKLSTAVYTPRSGPEIAGYQGSMVLSQPVNRASFEGAIRIYSTKTIQNYYYADSVAKDRLMIDKTLLTFTWTDATESAKESVAIALAPGAYLPPWAENEYILVVSGPVLLADATTSEATGIFLDFKVQAGFFRVGSSGYSGTRFTLTRDTQDPRIDEMTIVGTTATLTFSESMKGKSVGRNYGTNKVDDPTNFYTYRNGSSTSRPTAIVWNADGTQATLTWAATAFASTDTVKVSLSGITDPAGNYMASGYGEISRTAP